MTLLEYFMGTSYMWIKSKFKKKKCRCGPGFDGIHTATINDRIDAKSFKEAYDNGLFNNLGSAIVHLIEASFDLGCDKLKGAGIPITASETINSSVCCDGNGNAVSTAIYE